jgi:XTP/dITP diphosphohydrolase
MSKPKMVVASCNQNKIREFSQLFTDYEVVSQKELGFDEEVEETGTTFAENALIKARAAAKALGVPALADDSGLCVVALGGQPGVYSARYSGDHDDASNRKKLLCELKGKQDRRAYFQSAIALVYPDGKELLAEGKTYGTILEEERGAGGFGYDCLFLSDDLGKSFGEATAQEKNSVSHRSRALAALREKL